ncbi:MAG: HXXEE domain-containing protein [Cyanobacteria bacterium P01_H01_bin.74]
MNPTLFFLILAFCLLWIPMGQHTFLNAHWMKVGIFMAPFLLMTAFSFRQHMQPIKKDIRLLGTVMFVFYLIHQFEEHWIDLTGNLYALKPYLDAALRNLLGIADPTVALSTTTDIFVINTGMVWLVSCLAIVQAPKRLFPVLALAALILINGITHIMSGISTFSYNPGLLTAVVLFVPFAAWFYMLLLKAGAITRNNAILSLIWAILGHVILIAGLVACYTVALPRGGYYALLLLWSVLPSFVFSSRPTNKTSLQ